jgi:hypothetical protein
MRRSRSTGLVGKACRYWASDGSADAGETVRNVANGGQVKIRKLSTLLIIDLNNFNALAGS